MTNFKIISQDVQTRSETPLKRGTAGHRIHTDRNENLQQFIYRNVLRFTSLPHSSRLISILFSHLHKSDSFPRFTIRVLMHFTFSIHSTRPTNLTLVSGLHT